jgi:hypothetical protein
MKMNNRISKFSNVTIYLFLGIFLLFAGISFKRMNENGMGKLLMKQVGKVEAKSSEVSIWCGLSEATEGSSKILCEGMDPKSECPPEYTQITFGINEGTACSNLPGTDCNSSGTYYTCIKGDFTN